MANTDRARKLLVRTALATSATIATLVGAQNLAMLDASQLNMTETAVAQNAGEVSPVGTATPVTINHTAPALTILHVAPGIVILRQSGQAATAKPVTVAANATGSFQPPVPAQVTVPQPVIVQQPIRQRSRSSR